MALIICVMQMKLHPGDCCLLKMRIMAKGSKKLAFTEEELEIIRKLYADTPNKVIATMMPHSFTSISKKAHTMGLKKTKEHISKNGRAIAIAQWNNLIENNLQLSSNFKKGHVPWCKGQKLSSEHIGQSQMDGSFPLQLGTSAWAGA